jgi:hypothetical protein
MALNKGDYLVVREKVVEALLADTGAGGLVETGCPPVKTIEPRVRAERRQYSKYELPLIGVEVSGKKEQAGPSGRMVDKVFSLEFLALCRGGGRELEVERAQKIAARLECLIHAQNAANAQFNGLAKLIEGGQGVLIARVKETVFESRFFEDNAGQNPEVAAIVSAEITVPANI